MRKKLALISCITISLLSSCMSPNLQNLSNQLSGSSFKIKSTSDSGVINKVILSKEKIQKGFNNEKKFKFNITQDDLKRNIILNLVNGPDNSQVANRILLKVNNQTIIKPFEHINDFEDIELKRIKHVKERLCSDELTPKLKKFCKRNLKSSIFNKNTSSLSLQLNNLKVGKNTLEVIIYGKKDSSIALNIIGMLKPIDMPNAVFSNIPDTEEVRKAEYTKGKINIKFLETMKVRLETQNDGSKKLVDLNGTSLVSLERLLDEIGVKKIYRPVDIDPSELDMEELNSENNLGKDIANLNLFYTLELENKDVDVWEKIEELRELPFIEEAFPEFISQSTDIDSKSFSNKAVIIDPTPTPSAPPPSEDFPNDPLLKLKLNNNASGANYGNDWLKVGV
jgi:hypothetical protein